MFDWQQFLDSHRIDFITRGGNLARDNIGIACPFCGDDPSHHLGISLKNGYWHCWREPVPGSHSGRAPYRLIQQLLGVSLDTAKTIVEAGDRQYTGSDSTFADDILQKLGTMPRKKHLEVPTLQFPGGYFRLDHSPRFRRLYYPYLKSRGYSDSGIGWLVERFRLCCALSGPFCYRIIIPVYYRSRLVTWTARAIGDDPLRYRTLSHNPDTAARAGLPVAVANIKDTLLDYDTVWNGGNVLVVVEGPFDCLRITYLGEASGIRAVCLFGKAATPAQIELLAGLIPRYRRVVSLLDADTGLFPTVLPESLKVNQLLMPSGVKDPGELTVQQFGQLFPYGD